MFRIRIPSSFAGAWSQLPAAPNLAQSDTAILFPAAVWVSGIGSCSFPSCRHLNQSTLFRTHGYYRAGNIPRNISWLWRSAPKLVWQRPCPSWKQNSPNEWLAPPGQESLRSKMCATILNGQRFAPRVMNGQQFTVRTHKWARSSESGIAVRGFRRRWLTRNTLRRRPDKDRQGPEKRDRQGAARQDAYRPQD